MFVLQVIFNKKRMEVIYPKKLNYKNYEGLNMDMQIILYFLWIFSFSEIMLRF